MDSIFRRWDIGNPGEYKDWQHYEAARRIRRALRWYLPPGNSIYTSNFIGYQVLRLGELLHDGAILASVRRLSGGPGMEINLRRLREAL